MVPRTTVNEDRFVTDHRGTIIRFFRDVIGAGNIELLDELAADDYDDHVALPGQRPGRTGLKWRVGVIRAAFSPRQFLHDVLVDGDLVAVRWTLVGSYTGGFLGLAATHRQVTFDGAEMYRMRGGRMSEHWNVVDLLAFYRQVTGHAVPSEMQKGR